MTEAPEPKDKLDAATATAGVVNGPEDAPLDWRQVDWRRAEDDVRRLRQRIFTAAKAGDLKRVRNLQKLMLRSRANTLVCVRRVTERNAGTTVATAVAWHFCPPTNHRGLLEPGARQRARPVLRGAGRSDASGLPVRSRRLAGDHRDVRQRGGSGGARVAARG